MQGAPHRHHDPAHVRGQHRKWLADLSSWRAECIDASTELLRAQRLFEDVLEDLRAHEAAVRAHEQVVVVRDWGEGGAEVYPHVDEQARHQQLADRHARVMEMVRALMAALRHE